MIIITNPTLYNISMIHTAAALIAGSDLNGITVRPSGTSVELYDTTPANVQTNINTLFTQLNTLPVVTDTATIAADDVDTATITLVTAQSSLEYLVLLDGAIYSEGTVIPAAGVATLTLKTAIAGTYTVILINPDGLATGQVEIIAS